jgi:hypothetical protein
MSKARKNLKKQLEVDIESMKPIIYQDETQENPQVS